MSMLDDKERAVVETMIMRYNYTEALDYLQNHGMDMSQATYYRFRKKVESKKLERMQFIAEHFQELHLEKIDRLEYIEKLMWNEFENEKQPSRRVRILESIANAQPIITAYYHSSTAALDISARHAARTNKIVELPNRIIQQAATTTTTEENQEPATIPSEQDLKGTTKELWTEPSWVQCQMCTRFYKPTVIEFHRRICSARPLEEENQKSPNIGTSPAPIGNGCSVTEQTQAGTVTPNLDIAELQEEPEPTNQYQSYPTLAGKKVEIEALESGVKCSKCGKTFLNTVRFRMHSCTLSD
jgi:hypothetical protein